MTERRPKRITMAGMIYDAVEVLDWAMDPATGGLNAELFGPGLYGLAFMTIIEAGFVFSGNVGTGIVIARTKDGGWSPPAAVGISGLGMGFMIGASVKHIIYLVYDESTIHAMAGDVGFTLGAQLEASLGNWGRTVDITTILSNKGLGQNVGLSYSQGIFGGFSLEGAVCNPRSKVNEKFYGRKVRPKEILLEGTVEMPNGTLMPEIVAKLDKLCQGQSVHQLTEVEKSIRESVRGQVDQEGLEALREEYIEKVVDPATGKTQPLADGESIFTTLLR